MTTMDRNDRIDGRDMRNGGWSWVEQELFYTFAPLIGFEAAWLYQVMCQLVPLAQKNPLMELSVATIRKVSMMSQGTQHRKMEILVRIGMIEIVGRGAKNSPIYKLVTLRELAAVGIEELKRRLKGTTVPVGNDAPGKPTADVLAEAHGDEPDSPVDSEEEPQPEECRDYDESAAGEGDSAIIVPVGNDGTVEKSGAEMTLQEVRSFQNRGRIVPKTGGYRSSSAGSFNTHLANKDLIPPTPLASKGGVVRAIHASAATAPSKRQKQPQKLPGEAKSQGTPQTPNVAELDNAVAKVMRECGESEMRRTPHVIAQAMRLEASRTDDPAKWNALAERMIASWQAYLEVKNEGILRFPVGFRSFVSRGFWSDKRKWVYDREEIQRRRRVY